MRGAVAAHVLLLAAGACATADYPARSGAWADDEWNRRAPASDDNCTATCTGPPLAFNDSVPNVLLLSDSIGAQGSGYYLNVKAMLGPGSSTDGGGAVGNAYVQHTGGYGKGKCGTSFGVIACADLWLGHQQWSVIHFNWGLHDICASMYAPVTRDEYVANMEALYTKMKAALAPGGTLIWATTTPVPPSYKARNNTDVVAINALMADLFGPTGKHKDVVVHDLYSEMVQRCRREPGAEGYPQTDDCMVLQSNGVHCSDAGKQFTGVMTAAAILPYLLPSPPTPPTPAPPPVRCAVSGAAGGGVAWNAPVEMKEGQVTNPGDRGYTLVNVPTYLIGGMYVGSHAWPNGANWTWTISYAPPVRLYVWAHEGGFNAGLNASLLADGWTAEAASGFRRVGDGATALPGDGDAGANDPLCVWSRQLADGAQLSLGNLSGLLVAGAVSVCDEGPR